MSRTLGGHLVGRAAYEERRDLAEHAYESWVQQERQKLMDRENELLGQASQLDGFEAFWDTVPEFGKRRDRITMLEDFLSSHCQGA